MAKGSISPYRSGKEDYTKILGKSYGEMMYEQRELDRRYESHIAIVLADEKKNRQDYRKGRQK
jgi:hypothetical protein